jgi:hypothetical protein
VQARRGGLAILDRWTMVVTRGLVATIRDSIADWADHSVQSVHPHSFAQWGWWWGGGRPDALVDAHTQLVAPPPARLQSSAHAPERMECIWSTTTEATELCRTMIVTPYFHTSQRESPHTHTPSVSTYPGRPTAKPTHSELLRPWTSSCAKIHPPGLQDNELDAHPRVPCRPHSGTYG